MGLPVHQIFATLEEQMQILDEEPAGDPEEELDDEGQGADDLSEMKVELVEGDHGVNWLVVDGVHILHKRGNILMRSSGGVLGFTISSALSSFQQRKKMERSSL